MSNSPIQDQRIQELDVFRGVCALAVMLFHYVIHYHAIVGFDGAPHPEMDTEPWRNIGRLPVYTFFVISGFVICMTLDRCRTIGEFIVSRTSRILPVYWAAVLLTYMTWEMAPAYPYHLSLGQAALNLTLLQGILYVPDVDGVYWSLAIELYFYLGMGILFVVGGLPQLRKICAVWLGAALVYAYWSDSLPIYYRVVMLLNLKFAPFFVAGVSFYRLWARQGAALDRLLLAACAASLFAIYSLATAVAMAVVFGLFLLMVSGRLRWIVVAPLTYLGAISYALYLTHQMIGYQVISMFPANPLLRIAAAMAIAIGLASLMTFFIERPARKAIRAIYRRARTGVAGQETRISREIGLTSPRPRRLVAPAPRPMAATVRARRPPHRPF